MNTILESLNRGLEQLLSRSSGPLHCRLVIQPIISTILAIRAGLRDAREGQPAFFWAILTNPAERRRLIHSGWKDVGKIFIIAIVLDTIYQVIMLRTFYIIQALIAAITVALIPYILIRGPVTRLTRCLYRHKAARTNISAVNNMENSE